MMTDNNKKPEIPETISMTEADVDRWRASTDKPAVSTLTDDQRSQLAGHLAGHPNLLDAIRALIPADSAPTDETAAAPVQED